MRAIIPDPINVNKTADATDLPSAITLINSLKESVNDLLRSDRLLKEELRNEQASN